MPRTELGTGVWRRLWGRDRPGWEVSGNLTRRYARLLRRAGKIGLLRARQEYLDNETLHGRPTDDILTDLDLFETLDHSALQRGWNPIALQRSRDATAWVVTPISVITGISVLLRLADHDSVSRTAAVIAAIATTFVVRQLGSVVSLFLTRGT